MTKCRPHTGLSFAVSAVVGLGALGVLGAGAVAQERFPWQSPADARAYQSGDSLRDQGTPTYRRGNGAPAAQQPYREVQQRAAPDPYGPNGERGPNRSETYVRETPAANRTNRYDYGQRNDAYVPPRAAPNAAQQGYGAPQPPRYVKPYQPPAAQQYPRRYGSNDAYQPNYGDQNRRYEGDSRDYRDQRPPRMPHAGGYRTYSENEVVDAGHRFFGSLSNGLAKAIQWTFKRSGRPNGYILGEDAGGAFVAGLRYGEGKLYTKDHGVRRVFWQGPSIGYDFGGDGNRTMTLVYNLRSPRDVFQRFGGVQGAAYLVGGVSVQLLTADDITLAPIRTGVGLRLGANIGYLKYTRRPTWNPF